MGTQRRLIAPKHTILFVFKLEFQIGFSKCFVDFGNKFLWLEVFHLRKGKLMQEHDSKPQNPIITNVLYKSKILESWGRGIGTMVDECKRVGLPAPEFNTDRNFVWVVFKYKRDNVPVTPQLSHNTPTSTQQVQELISIIKDREYSVKEIMSLLNLKDRVNFLRIYLNPALEDGFISMKYPEQPKSPKQKYLLTEKGKVLLK